MVAKRGIMFEFDTSVAPGAEKALDAIEKRIDALQKRMHMTLSVTERGARASAAANGGVPSANGTSPAAVAKAAERADDQTRASRKRLSDARLAADERDRLSAERSAKIVERANRDSLDQQIKDLRQAAAQRQRIIAEAAREDARGWKRLSAMGKESYVGGRKVGAGFEALSEMGRAAMPRDPFAEGLKNLADAKAMRSGWAGLGTAGAEQQGKLNALRAVERKDAEDRKRALDSQKGQLREINSALYDVAHAFGQVTRAAGQFSLIGQRDMMKVLDTIFAIEGGINAVQGGMNAFRAISSIRKARAGMAAGGAAKYAAGLARIGGGAAGAGGIGGGLGTAAGVGGAGGIGIGLAGAGVTALAAGGIGLLGTIADRRRGVPGQVGGFWDTIGKGIASPVGSIQGGFMSLGSAIERRFNEPYGLTDKESDYRSQRLQEEEFERSFGANGANDSRYAAIKRAKLHERRTELLEKYTNREIGRRAQQRDLRNRIDAEILPLEYGQRQARQQFAEQQYDLRTAGIRARGANVAGQLGEAFGRQQTAHGELAGLQARKAAGDFVDPAQLARAAAEQAREEGRVTSFADRQRDNLLVARKANQDRGIEIGRELHTAQQNIASATSEVGKEQFSREALAAQEKLKKNEEELLRIDERIRETKQGGIEDLRRELALRQQSLATAKQTVDNLRGQRQSATERFGNLNPMQRRATLEAARMFKAGVELQEPQLDLLRNLPEVFGPQLRARAGKKAEESGIQELLRLGGFNERFSAVEAAEKRAIDVEVNARNEIAVKLNANTDAMSKELTEKLTPIFKSIMQTAVNSLAEQLHMAQGQDFSKAAEMANAAGGP